MYATISCGVARTMAAARPYKSPVASSSFVSEYITNAECFDSFAPAELASNTANMASPFAISASSSRSYT
jgi:hypothetical protein